GEGQSPSSDPEMSTSCRSRTTSPFDPALRSGIGPPFGSAAQVSSPTMPSTSRPAPSWNRSTAASVSGPKSPSRATLRSGVLRRARWARNTAVPCSPRLIRGCPGFGISSSLFDDTMEAPLPPSSINLQSTETANKSATNLRAGARETASAGTHRSPPPAGTHRSLAQTQNGPGESVPPGPIPSSWGRARTVGPGPGTDPTGHWSPFELGATASEQNRCCTAENEQAPGRQTGELGTGARHRVTTGAPGLARVRAASGFVSGDDELP